MKNVVILNCGHHIIYGNCSKDDMQLYETLAGKTFTISEQKTVTEIPISSPDTMKSFSSRFTPQYENTFDRYCIRNKDFQEVTVFGVNGGDHVKPFEGKLSFLTKEQKEGKKRCKIEWSFFTREEEEGPLPMIKALTKREEPSLVADLTSLMDYGLVIKQFYEYTDEIYEERSATMYCASPGLPQKVVLSDKKNDFIWYQGISLGEMTSILAFNQFHIALILNVQRNICRHSFNFLLEMMWLMVDIN